MRCFERLGVLVVPAFLAACQPLPQPFAEARPAHNPLLVIPDSVGVSLSPISGLDERADAAIANALIAALEKENIPAMRGGGTRASYLLAAAASQARPNAAGITATAVSWHLVHDGQRVLILDRRLRLQGGRILPEDLAVLNGVATEVARRLQAESPSALAGAGPAPALRLAIPPVAGAPGDGATALASAMLGFLRGKGVLADTTGAPPEALKLVGTVTMGPPRAGQQMVEIAWTLQTPDGREIGNIRQSNPVPAGSLNGKWGEVAGYAAEAAAEGVLDLIEQAQRAPNSGL